MGDLIKQQLLWFDRKASSEKKRSVYLQMLLTLSLAIVPPLILLALTTTESHRGILVVAAILSTMSLLFSTTIYVFNPASRWEQYRMMRQELRNRLFDLEVMSTKFEGEVTADQLTDFYERYVDLMQKQSSMWYFAEASHTDPEMIDRRSA